MRAARQPRAHAARALAAPTPRVRPPPRAADNDEIGEDALAAIESLLDANKARPPASVRHAFASARDPNP